jgi:hypothetical protein
MVGAAGEINFSKGHHAMTRIIMALSGLLILASGSCTQVPSPIEKYRNLEFPPKDLNFAKGWQDRVVAEFDVINHAELTALRGALKDADPFVRAIAARALGIRGDKESADALAELAKTDKEYFVRLRAVESLGYLKMKPEVIQQAIKDRDAGVSWVAKLAAEQVKTNIDYAKQLREAYAAGIKRDAIATAQLGKPAPDFTALTSDGKPFRLSSILGKKPIAIYFAAYDG